MQSKEQKMTIPNQQGSKSLKMTILSMSVITVMAGAAVSPALSHISQHFSHVNPLYIQMILTVPGIFIMLTSLLFPKISKYMTSKTIALIGIFLYIIGGVMGGMANNIFFLLVTRAVIGIGVGMIMPLSTGLLAYHFDSSQQGKLLGYSSAMNSLGGMIAMSLSGVLAAINWRFSFAVYLIGLLVFIAVLIFLPAVSLAKKPASSQGSNNMTGENVRVNKKFVILMFLTHATFYVFVVNFSMISVKQGIATPENVGILMAIQTGGALVASTFFGRLQGLTKNNMNFIGSILFFASYILLFGTQSYIITGIALAINGIGFGTLMPYLNSQALRGIPKEQTSNIMAYMSSAVFLGQFASPLCIGFIKNAFHIEIATFPYAMGAVLSLIIFSIMFISSKRKIQAL